MGAAQHGEPAQSYGEVFEAWCKTAGLDPASPDAQARFVTALLESERAAADGPTTPRGP